MIKSVNIGTRKINIIHKQTTASTNTDALRCEENTLIVADVQTAGRGRLGRSFRSLQGGVYMSLSIKTPKDAGKLTTAAAAAAANAIEKQSGKATEIKWVNDIYINSKKVCGILAQTKNEGKNGGITALGVGINLVNLVPFEGELKDKAGFVYTAGDFKTLRQDIIKRFLEEFFAFYEGKTENIKKEYEKRDFLLGKTVKFIRDGKEQTGTACGFDGQINLLVNANGKKQAICCGEVITF